MCLFLFLGWGQSCNDATFVSNAGVATPTRNEKLHRSFELLVNDRLFWHVRSAVVEEGEGYLVVYRQVRVWGETVDRRNFLNWPCSGEVGEGLRACEQCPYAWEHAGKMRFSQHLSKQGCENQPKGQVVDLVRISDCQSG